MKTPPGARSCRSTACCESACDGVCSACDLDGRCADTPADDIYCEVVTCAEATSCTTYPPPLITNRCSEFGACTTTEEYCQPSRVSEGTECGSGLVCDGEGACTSACSTSELWCSGECIDPTSNGAHCGECDMPCAAPLVCTDGTCAPSCSASQVACGTNCINPMTNAEHCGASGDCTEENAGQTCSLPYTGDVCGSGEQCLLGSCRLPDGDTCNAGVDCVSGICTAFYLDIDGDGYGAQSSGLQRVCGAQPPTADYVTNNLDCCDNASDLTLAAKANPDFVVPNWPALSVPGCSKPFDWNCDGVETPREPRGGCAQHTSQTSCSGSYAGQPACGSVGEFHYCFWNADIDECVPGSIEGRMLHCY